MASTRKITNFRYRFGNLPLPVFFPDATRGVVKSIDTSDLEETKTPGVLVNTYHLYKEIGGARIKKLGGIGKFMGWSGAIISDSGGFQVGSLIKQNSKLGYVNDLGAHFRQDDGKRITLTPEESIRFQMSLGVDMVVVLDDFTDPKADHSEAEDSVRRTVLWAERSKKEFNRICKAQNLAKNKRPYILGVVQGGEFMDLRKSCTKDLVGIGFDGLGWGGWPIVNGKLNFESAKIIADNSPDDYLLYGLGIGKPSDIVILCDIGYSIFDCVLPTRDARHKRLYVYNSDSIAKINIEQENFYSFINLDKKGFLNDSSPVSTACDCLLCKKYSKGYLAHLFRIGDFTAGRLATIHNLRFYSLLMDKLREALDKK
jgi:queuine tRNA-ribosyltransferase